MIHGLIEAMPGGFDTMNKFVRESIRNALVTMHRQFLGTLGNHFFLFLQVTFPTYDVGVFQNYLWKLLKMEPYILF